MTQRWWLLPETASALPMGLSGADPGAIEKAQALWRRRTVSRARNSSGSRPPGDLCHQIRDLIAGRQQAPHTLLEVVVVQALQVRHGAHLVTGIGVALNRAGGLLRLGGVLILLNQSSLDLHEIFHILLT